jgi:hypothetical protein
MPASQSASPFTAADLRSIDSAIYVLNNLQREVQAYEALGKGDDELLHQRTYMLRALHALRQLYNPGAPTDTSS